jgi:hypothetical protein
MTAQQLFTLICQPSLRLLHRWWIRRSENHFLMCANVEADRAKEAQQNVAYYQRQAAMARSKLRRV